MPAKRRRTGGAGGANSAGAATLFATVLLASGCANSPPAPPPVDLTTIYGQLADACRRERGLQLAAPAGRVGPADRREPQAAADLSRQAAVAPPAACIETGTLARTVSPNEEAISSAQPAGGALAGLLAAKNRRIGDGDNEREGSGVPHPLHLRYAPSSSELRRADALALAAKFAEAATRDDVRLAIAVGPGGLGNAFEQATIAQNRVRLVNQMLPPGLVTSIAFDPELADDTLTVTFVTAGQ